MIPREVKDRYEKLKTAIDHYRREFHVYDRETISEEARDSLMHELTDIEARFPSLVTPDSPSQRVAGKPLPQFKKVRHEVPQWSFNDAFTSDDMRAFDERVRRSLSSTGEAEPPAGGFASSRAMPAYLCELKIDGLKIVFTYEKGRLVRAATAKWARMSRRTSARSKACRLCFRARSTSSSKARCG